MASGLVLACGAPAPTHSVRGVLLTLDTSSIQRVERFSLRTDAGDELVFSVASDFNAGASHAMSPGHMRQHMAQAEAITVTYREDSGQLVALRATD